METKPNPSRHADENQHLRVGMVAGTSQHHEFAWMLASASMTELEDELCHASIVAGRAR